MDNEGYENLRKMEEEEINCSKLLLSIMQHGKAAFDPQLFKL